MTVQTGKSTSGNRSTPSSPYEKRPSTTGIATRTQVNTGRLIQTSEMVIGLCLVMKKERGSTVIHRDQVTTSQRQSRAGRGRSRRGGWRLVRLAAALGCAGVRVHGSRRVCRRRAAFARS